MIAVVTGGSRGIGAAVMRDMTARGYDCRDLSRSSGYDAGDEASVNRFFGALERIDVLVNNAAILELAPLIDMKVETWDEVIRVDLRGAFLCSQAALRLMRPGGTIVNVSSLSGVSGTDKFPRMSAYVAAKSGLAGLTEVLAVEGRPLGIRVNAVSPASVATDMGRLAGISQEPLSPEEVARVITWLATADSAPLTGANIRIDPPARG
ncbi:MAG TPA: SDR family oxidoreductase [Candidatus Dormibacteraeota bacterium]|nr:SDR family oxidoreductase [Candidatus Dormibacteraeota bacterium]